MAIFILSYLVFHSALFAGDSRKIAFHNLRLTDSEPIVSDWNVDSSRRIKNYVKEEIDSENRVSKLTTYINGTLAEQSCYVVPIISYQYKKDTIIQRSFQNGKLAYTELDCGGYQRTEYILSSDSILYCVNYNDRLDYLKKPSPKDSEEYREYYQAISKYQKGIQENCFGVLGYDYSIAKRNGKDPAFKK